MPEIFIGLSLLFLWYASSVEKLVASVVQGCTITAFVGLMLAVTSLGPSDQILFNSFLVTDYTFYGRLFILIFSLLLLVTNRLNTKHSLYLLSST